MAGLLYKFCNSERREDIIAAALLHDVLEDTACQGDEIIEALDNGERGKRILKIVQVVTKDKNMEDRRTRRESFLASLEKLDGDIAVDALYVLMADKIHNLYSGLNEIEKYGVNEYWEMFSRESAKEDRQRWYDAVYEKALKIIEGKKINDQGIASLLALYKDLNDLFEKLSTYKSENPVGVGGA